MGYSPGDKVRIAIGVYTGVIAQIASVEDGYYLVRVNGEAHSYDHTDLEALPTMKTLQELLALPTMSWKDFASTKHCQSCGRSIEDACMEVLDENDGVHALVCFGCNEVLYSAIL